MITVYYDGKCSVCLKEINYYRRIAPEGVFVWCDITEPEADFEKAGITLTQGLKQLHVRDQYENMQVGVKAFITIWGQLNRWRIVAKIVALPLIYQVVCVLYKCFAARRFKKLSHCQIAEASEK